MADCGSRVELPASLSPESVVRHNGSRSLSYGEICALVKFFFNIQNRHTCIYLSHSINNTI